MVAQTELIYCPTRKEWVAALPEEYVRQRFLQHMMVDRGYPASLIVVEKSLRQLPHLNVDTTASIPRRRIDIMCFAKDPGNCKGDLTPLILVECKAVALTKKVISQVVGYNHFIQARFIVVVNQDEMRTGFYDVALGEYNFINHLPSFEDLANTSC